MGSVLLTCGIMLGIFFAIGVIYQLAVTLGKIVLAMFEAWNEKRRILSKGEGRAAIFLAVLSGSSLLLWNMRGGTANGQTFGTDHLLPAGITIIVSTCIVGAASYSMMRWGPHLLWRLRQARASRQQATALRIKEESGWVPVATAVSRAQREAAIRLWAAYHEASVTYQDDGRYRGVIPTRFLTQRPASSVTAAAGKASRPQKLTALRHRLRAVRWCATGLCLLVGILVVINVRRDGYQVTAPHVLTSATIASIVVSGLLSLHALTRWYEGIATVRAESELSERKPDPDGPGDYYKVMEFEITAEGLRYRLISDRTLRPGVHYVLDTFITISAQAPISPPDTSVDETCYHARLRCSLAGWAPQRPNFDGEDLVPYAHAAVAYVHAAVAWADRLDRLIRDQDMQGTPVSVSLAVERASSAEKRVYAQLHHENYPLAIGVAVPSGSQHPDPILSNYWPDIAVREPATALLVDVEIDGPHHRLPERIAADAQRDRCFMQRGWYVVRLDVPEYGNTPGSDEAFAAEVDDSVWERTASVAVETVVYHHRQAYRVAQAMRALQEARGDTQPFTESAQSPSPPPTHTGVVDLAAARQRRGVMATSEKRE